jgi:citrate synthase
MNTVVNNGLEGIVAAETRLSMVDGERGELVIGGFSVEELASWSFEDTVELLWAAAGFHGRPSTASMPAHTETLLRDAAQQCVPPMDALRMAAGTLRAEDDDAAAKLLVGTFPTIVAAYSRLLNGQEPIAPRSDLGMAANYLYMLSGIEPHAELVRGMETYLNTVVDHGLNASTFTARVIASTGSDFVSAITGAVGALKGPLHGGAPGPALDMVFEIAETSRAEDVLRRKIADGERLMGFGHRVYKVRDPRADVLAAAAERMFTRTSGGSAAALEIDMRLYDLARAVEATALRLLEEHKPGRKLQTNVEFYTALLLHGLGLEVPLFTPTFAISRVAGWTAHCFEQRKVGRLIRPQSVYVGASPES